MNLLSFEIKKAILDYFWIPTGTWQGIHWKSPFFRDNLPGLVHNNLLHYGDLNKNTQLVHTTKDIQGGDYITSDCGVVYLPFCENCMVEVVAWSKVLQEVFTISFMLKENLDEHVLWRATNTISAQSMQDWLGKKLDQEEDYCKVSRQKLVHGSAIGLNHVDRDDVLDVFGRIKNVDDVRMIKLTALRKFHPEFKKNGKKWPCRRGVDVGGFVGLLKSAKLAKAKSPPPEAAFKASPIKASSPRRKAPLNVASKAASRSKSIRAASTPKSTSPAAPSKKAEKQFLELLKSLLSLEEDAAIKVSESGEIVIKNLQDLELFGGSDDFIEVCVLCFF